MVAPRGGSERSRPGGPQHRRGGPAGRRWRGRWRGADAGALAAVVIVVAGAAAALGLWAATGEAAPRPVVVRAGARSGAGAGTTSPTDRPTTTTLPPTTTTTAPPPVTVGVVTMTFTDIKRGRTLVTAIRYPARGGSTTTDNQGATPVSGRHALIVFAHGFDTDPSTYGALLDAWARAGYVVAAPVFPRTSNEASLDEADLVNQPADVSFVIGSLLAASQSGSGPLAGLVDPQEIGVAGHSDGGNTVAAVGYDSCCQDPRVKAVAVLSGAEYPWSPGSFFTNGGPPLLVVQGTADTVNPPASSQAIYAADPGPKYQMLIQGGTHLAPYAGPVGPELSTVEQATTDFFDAELRDRSGAAARLLQDGNVAGVASITAANTP